MNVNLLFLDLVDTLVTEMSTADVAVLANKCGTLMASDVYQIPLFTQEFMNKLTNCVYPFIFKMYLLPYMSWLDCCLLKQLVNFTSNKSVLLKMVDQFIDSLDYNELVTSYHIPEFSQLLIPLDSSQHTLLATMHIQSIDKLILQDVVNIKKSLIRRLEITDHAVQLIAMHSKSCCFYWLMPNQIRSLVEDKLNQQQWDKGVVLSTLLPANFLSVENTFQHDLFNISSEDRTEVYITYMY